MTQVGLQTAGIHPFVSQCITTSVSEHVGVHREAQLRTLTPPCQLLPEPGSTD